MHITLTAARAAADTGSFRVDNILALEALFFAVVGGLVILAMVWASRKGKLKEAASILGCLILAAVGFSIVTTTAGGQIGSSITSIFVNSGGTNPPANGK